MGVRPAGAMNAHNKAAYLEEARERAVRLELAASAARTECGAEPLPAERSAGRGEYGGRYYFSMATNEGPIADFEVRLDV